MSENPSQFHQFGKCRLDSEKKVLWFNGQPVPLPLKAIEVLTVLVERNGEVVTKDEIWNSVWQDSFVEETNLTHNIYLLRKTLKGLGEPDVIQTVPRRGYRFVGETVWPLNGDLVIEKHSFSRTLVEELPNDLAVTDPRTGLPARRVDIMPWAAALGLGVALLVAGVVFLAARSTRVDAPARLASIAVLPLTSLERSEEDLALGLGIADALITRLGKQNEIRVVSTKTSSRYLDSSKEPHEIGRELGVEGVLDGTIQRADGRVRVSLRLVRSIDGVQMWSGLITDTEEEIFRLEDALALQTAQALSLNLKPDSDPVRPTTSLDAYHHYLKADYLFRMRGDRNTERSVSFFREATRLDPNFARAWAGWAAALAMGTNIPEAEELLDKAMQRDPDLAEAHATRGFIQMFHYWNWPEAEASFNRAIMLDPNSLQAHHWRGVYLSFHGRFDEARAEMERALELDPVSVNITSDLGQLYYLAGDSVRAEEYCRRALSIDPDYGMAHGYLGRIFEAQGKTADALEHWARGNCWASEDRAGCIAEYLNQYGGQGSVVLTENAEKVITKRTNASSQGRANAYYNLAIDAVRQRDPERAIELLHRSIETKAKYEIMNFTFPYLAVEPQFATLRSHPGFQDVVRRLNLQTVRDRQ